VSANEKNQRARGDYSVLHRSLEAVESKKDSVLHYSLIVTIHYTVHYSLSSTLFTVSVDFSASKSVDSDSATAELGTQQRMIVE
jgi:hypothetical protein